MRLASSSCLACADVHNAMLYNDYKEYLVKVEQLYTCIAN